MWEITSRELEDKPLPGWKYLWKNPLWQGLLFKTYKELLKLHNKKKN